MSHRYNKEKARGDHIELSSIHYESKVKNERANLIHEQKLEEKRLVNFHVESFQMLNQLSRRPYVHNTLNSESEMGKVYQIVNMDQLFLSASQKTGHQQSTTSTHLQASGQTSRVNSTQGERTTVKLNTRKQDKRVAQDQLRNCAELD